MKMQLEQHRQRRQAILQLHLSDQQFFCLFGAPYIKGFTVILKSESPKIFTSELAVDLQMQFVGQYWCRIVLD